MDITIQENLKGHFLLAMPGLTDPNFYRTVTLICEHTTEGAMGVIIDRVIDELRGETLFRELGLDFLPDQGGVPLYFGGPVHMDEVFILHGPPFHWAGCHPVSPRLALSNTLDLLGEIALGRGPDDYLIALGCAGWGDGQLEAELRDNAWLTGDASLDILFRTPAARKWADAIEALGIDPNFISQDAGNA